MLAIGAVALVVAGAGDRVRALEIGGAKMELAPVTELVRSGIRAQERGDADTADRLFLEARSLWSQMYEDVRRREPGPERDRLLRAMVEDERRKTYAGSY